MRLSVKLNSLLEIKKPFCGKIFFLGSELERVDSPLYFLVWIFGIEFALRAPQEDRNLRLKNSQL